MEFGKLEHLEGVDFSLPPEDPASREVLPGRRAPRVRVHAGPTGWAMKEWVGRVYPLGAQGADFLAHYGRQFNGVELNATHYRVPEPEGVARWREAVPEGFAFCPKFPQDVSHALDFAAAQAPARAFAERMRLLGDRLGRAFLQLPPHVGPREAGALAGLLDALPERFPVAVELRHPGWFERGGRLGGAARGLLAPRGAVAVMTDVAGRRDVLHASLTAPAVLVRFVGNGGHPTDLTRLDAWAERLAGWLAQGLEEVSFFLHQPDNLLAPELSNAFVERLNRAAGLSLQPWRKPGGEQLSLL
jgi:uncharacterized protein YecE (DUF72 family)